MKKRIWNYWVILFCFILDSYKKMLKTVSKKLLKGATFISRLARAARGYETYFLFLKDLIIDILNIPTSGGVHMNSLLEYPAGSAPPESWFSFLKDLIIGILIFRDTQCHDTNLDPILWFTCYTGPCEDIQVSNRVCDKLS